MCSVFFCICVFIRIWGGIFQYFTYFSILSVYVPNLFRIGVCIFPHVLCIVHVFHMFMFFVVFLTCYVFFCMLHIVLNLSVYFSVLPVFVSVLLPCFFRVFSHVFRTFRYVF
jgi:hypothetical protein